MRRANTAVMVVKRRLTMAAQKDPVSQKEGLCEEITGPLRRTRIHQHTVYLTVSEKGGSTK
jgi:hypothetical protein